MGNLEPEAARLSERQTRIAERLDGLSATLGDLFRAAVREQGHHADHASIRLAAHACREIVNRLPDYLDVPVIARLEYGSRIGEISDRWPEYPSEPPSDESLRAVAQLVQDHRQVRTTLRQHAEHLFSSLARGDDPTVGDASARARMWVDLQNYFHGVAHVPRPGVPDPSPEDFAGHFSRLERMLASQLQAEGYYASQADLQTLIAAEEPSEDDADAVVALLRGELRRTFFEHAKSPKWLPLLRSRGYFQRPPAPIVDAQYTSFPGWPEARYLIKIAAVDPQGVATAILEMEATENSRVHADLLEAALEMPATISASLVRLADRWLDDSFLMLVPQRASALVAKLAEGHEIEKAAFLSRRYLLLRERRTDQHGSFGEHFQVAARVDEWEYQQFLEGSFKVLLSVAPLEGTKVLRDLLRMAVVLERKRWQTDHDDGFKIVRERVEQHEPYPALANLLVTALRDATVVVSELPELIPALLGLLRDRDELIFRRIELHLLQAHIDVPAWASRRAELLLDDSLYANYAVAHEYEALLHRFFETLQPDDQAWVIKRIEAGPPKEYRENVIAWMRKEREPGPAELDERWEQWRLRSLAPIKDALAGESAARYAARVERHGDPTFPEERSDRGGWVGPNSEVGAADLQAMEPNEVFQFLRDWQPQDDWRAPTREGQARALSVAVEEDPEKWASNAIEFRNAPPIYARHLFQGLDAAMRSEKVVDSWESVLALADFVLEQPPGDTAESGLDDDDDHDHRPSRRAVAHLLYSTLGRRDAIPFSERQRVWLLIDTLAHDIDPLEANDRDAKDPAHMSLNRTRGIAMRAAVMYGRWCGWHLETDERSFDLSPELRELLEEKLDPLQESTRTVRSVFGQYFPYLLYLDPAWAGEHLDAIFPVGDAQRSFRSAAWSAFVRFAPQDYAAVTVLLPEFLREAEALSADKLERLGDDHTRLSEYVSYIFLVGFGPIGDEVVDAFFARASQGHRAHTIRHIGLSMRRMTLDVNQRGRAKQLWAMRLTSLHDEDAELQEYGWWFTSSQLLDAESVGLLASTIEKARGKIDNPKEVLEALLPLGLERPRETLRILESLVAGGEGFTLDYARDELRSLVAALLQAGDQALVDPSRAIIHALGERGIHGLEDLL